MISSLNKPRYFDMSGNQLAVTCLSQFQRRANQVHVNHKKNGLGSTLYI